MHKEKTKFVLLASQRTGSNLLNSILNQYDGITMHGEAFNGAFVGLREDYHDTLKIKREDIAARDKDPLGFMERLYSKTEADAVGFHMFPEHSPSVLKTLLEDPNVKKIGLRRSVFPSYVSLLEAQASNVWRVSNDGSKARKGVKEPVVFEPAKFEKYHAKLNAFWKTIIDTMNNTNQEFFPIFYAKIKDVETTNKLVEFIGLEGNKKRLDEQLKKQSYSSLEKRVANYSELEAYAKEKGLSHHLY